MAYKVFGILKRPDGMTFQQFKDWWLEVQQELTNVTVAATEVELKKWLFEQAQLIRNDIRP